MYTVKSQDYQQAEQLTHTKPAIRTHSQTTTRGPRASFLTRSFLNTSDVLLCPFSFIARSGYFA